MHPLALFKVVAVWAEVGRAVDLVLLVDSTVEALADVEAGFKVAPLTAAGQVGDAVEVETIGLIGNAAATALSVVGGGRGTTYTTTCMAVLYWALPLT